MTNRHQDPFNGLKPFEAPAGLKTRVLEAARGAESYALPRRTLVDRMWENRWLRPAWAAAVAALIALNIHWAPLPSPVDHSPRSVGMYLLTGQIYPPPPALRGRNVTTLAGTAPLLKMLLDEEQTLQIVLFWSFLSQVPSTG